ncbi:Flp pilus assembly protein CpaB [Rhodobacter sp. SGA-6-6]|uniref:Flp pilus assembly protein CpaB n=1 Tax=Rhodobacter sp. SGA-6-6 TaxID=2710882 RepID=UPI0013ED97B6|nr:Flp pilus assembly protein CpaB [Rhodobacter sp. SGA-6-6]NGM45984.1 Flp pilus assembly protein CpaB [Rhodobacter sp. SGA-6-6]
MRFKIIALISLGIVLAVAAGLGTFQYTRALETELSATRKSLADLGETVSLPVPLRDIPAGTALQPSDFGMKPLPASIVPQNVLRDLPQPAEGQSLVSMAPLAEGALLLFTDVGSSDASTDFGLVLSQGARAFAIAPRNLAEFADRLAPGATVDIIWTRTAAQGRMESRLLGSGVRVLAVPGDAATGDATAADKMAGKLIVEGNEEEAMRYILAAQTGFFHILLSNGDRRADGKELVLSADELADLPVVTREGTASGAGTGAEDDPGLVARITGGGAGRPTCTTAIIRAGSRAVFEVPC